MKDDDHLEVSDDDDATDLELVLSHTTKVKIEKELQELQDEINSYHKQKENAELETVAIEGIRTAEKLERFAEVEERKVDIAAEIARQRSENASNALEGQSLEERFESLASLLQEEEDRVMAARKELLTLRSRSDVSRRERLVARSKVRDSDLAKLKDLVVRMETVASSTPTFRDIKKHQFVFKDLMFAIDDTLASSVSSQQTLEPVEAGSREGNDEAEARTLFCKYESDLFS